MPSCYRCFACMHPLPSQDAVCPVCGHDNRIRTNGSGLLPEMLLNGQYLVGRVLGRGGFGITYIGYDFKLDRVVAIKEFFPSHLVNRDTHTNLLSVLPDSQQDFQKGCQKAIRESKMAAKLGQIPGIVQVYNVFSQNNTVYIVMEFIDGVTLTQYVRNAPGRISLTDAITLLAPVAQALCRLHEMEVVHRDVKPDNIMIRSGSHISVLLDFGAARDRDGSTLSRSAAVVSMGYTPVEQYNSYGMDGRIDEYAFCATLYYTLLGAAPPESILRLVEKNTLSLRSENPSISQATENVILKGMAVMAGNRYPSMQEMWNALLATQNKHSGFPAKKAAAVAVSAAIIAGAGYFLLRANEAVPLPTAVSPTPSAVPTPIPTATPTVLLTPTPTLAPTVTPTAVLTATPTVVPTPTPTLVPTATPTAVPTATSTAIPTPTPTLVPTATPTAVPTATPTAIPTPTPTLVPTATPTAVPTATPTAIPTPTPTLVPTATPTAVPTAMPTVVPTPTLAPTPTPTVFPLPLVHPEVQVGSYLTFGRYEQDNNQQNGKESIDWVVLERQGNHVLMLGEYVLEPAPSFGDKNGTWENSDLRKWLNNYFPKIAFTEEEKDSLVKHSISSDAFSASSIEDSIYLLSAEEVMQYYPDEADRRAKATLYAQSQNIRNLNDEGYCWWWLRSCQYSSNNKCSANVIRNDGVITTSQSSTRGNGIRPAIWVNLDSAFFAKEIPAEPAQTDPEPVMPEIQVGAHITFGRFESDDDLTNGPDPLKWQVLDRHGDQVLVMTEQIIGMRYYTGSKPTPHLYNDYNTSNWQDSWYRIYLNRDFLTAFTQQELSAVPAVTVKAAEHPFTKSTKNAQDTLDQFFILSYEEVEKYLPTEESRKAQGMLVYVNELLLEGHAKKNISIQSNWLIRSPRVDDDGYGYNMCGIDADGKLQRKLNPLGWRPACWIDLSKAQDAIALVQDDKIVSGWEAGTEFTLGHFEQDLNEGVEPVEWQIIKREGNRALALSKHVLHAMKYDQDSRATWEDSSVRKWLNGTFLSETFTEQEQSILAQRTVRPEEAFHGNPVSDRVFLISRTELEACLPDAADRLASPTPYAIEKKAGYVNKEGYCWWWLRGSAKGNGYSNTVKNDGKFDSRSVNFATLIGVRPAIWINLDAENFSSVVKLLQ